MPRQGLLPQGGGWEGADFTLQNLADAVLVGYLGGNFVT